MGYYSEHLIAAMEEGHGSWPYRSAASTYAQAQAQAQADAQAQALAEIEAKQAAFDAAKSRAYERLMRIAPDIPTVNRLHRAYRLDVLPANAPATYYVSSSNWGKTNLVKYKVRLAGTRSTCTCPDFRYRQKACKHILAAWLYHAAETETD